MFLANVDIAVANIAGPSIPGSSPGPRSAGGWLRRRPRPRPISRCCSPSRCTLQQGLGRSAAYSGLALVSWVAAFGIPGPALGRFPARVRTLAAPAGAVILAAGFASLAASLYSGDTSGALLMTLLGVAGLGLGTTFTGMLSHLTSSVTGEHASDLSGLFNTITRAGRVLGAAAFGTAYLALARDHQPVHSFATINPALAVSALAAAALAGLSVWPRPPSRRYRTRG
jgi:MFS family permease